MIGEGNSLVEEVYACHEAFCRLGFRTEDIYVVPNALVMNALSQKDHVVVRLCAQGKEFNLTVAEREGTEEEFMAAWSTWVRNIRGADEAALQRIWERSFVYANSVQFVAAMLAKGFVFPKGNQALN